MSFPLRFLWARCAWQGKKGKLPKPAPSAAETRELPAGLGHLQATALGQGESQLPPNFASPRLAAVSLGRSEALRRGTPAKDQGFCLGRGGVGVAVGLALVFFVQRGIGQ